MAERVAVRRSESLVHMALFVLVLSQYDLDPDDWIYSKSASTKAALEALACYDDPPNTLPRAEFEALHSWKLPSPIPPCDRPGSPRLGGTIYQLQQNA